MAPEHLVRFTSNIPWPAWVDTIEGLCIHANMPAQRAWGAVIGTHITDLDLDEETLQVCLQEDKLVREGNVVESEGSFVIKNKVYEYHKRLVLLDDVIFGFCIPTNNKIGMTVVKTQLTDKIIAAKFDYPSPSIKSSEDILKSA